MGDREQHATKVKPQILKGFRDYLPEHMLLRQEVISRFRTVFERYGFDPFDTPAIEYLDILTGKAGENEKLMYAFTDQGGRDVGLRYDLTVPLARAAAMHQSEFILPFRRYHIAPVWRAEKPQRGRFREFWQCDADIVGAPSVLADAEVVALLGDALDSVGLPNFVIKISHRQLLERVAVYAGIDEDDAALVYRSVDKLDKIGPERVVEDLTKGGIHSVAAAKLIEIVTNQSESLDKVESLSSILADDELAMDALSDIRQLLELLPGLGLDAQQVTFDLSLARGLDYYTGLVFEAEVEEPRVGSVAGGGRYEGLVGRFANREISATGVSIGLERILEVVKEFDTIEAQPVTTQVLVVTFRNDVDRSIEVAERLRRSGLRVELAVQPNKSVGEQLKYGGRKGIPFAAIPGEEELESDQIGLKNLETGEQVTVRVNDVASTVRANETIE